MRVVHVVNTSRVSTLGIERRVIYLAGAQKACGNDVKIVIDRPGVFTEFCREQDIPVAVVDGLDSEGNLLALPTEKTVELLTPQFTNPAADIIHCHSLSAAVKAIPVANQLNIPCVFNSDGTNALMAAKKLGMNFAIISLSEAGFENVKRNGTPDMDVYYIAIGSKAVGGGRPHNMSKSVPTNLMIVGSLITRKGVDVAILAMAELRRRRGADCPVLNVYGDGDQEQYLKEMTAVLGLEDSVIFHGIQPGVLEYCPDDILILASRLEVGPLVVVEAMSRGLPIVATNVGEVSKFLPDKRYGRIVPTNSILALADAVESLLSDIEGGQFNPELLIERHRSLFSDEKMAERTEAVYKKLLLDTAAAR
jgi:hypothetical protein